MPDDKEQSKGEANGSPGFPDAALKKRGPRYCGTCGAVFSRGSNDGAQSSEDGDDELIVPDFLRSLPKDEA